uniref:Glycosyl transferase CAP10 domain-containing protein n=1 Tax=Strigamia maritima TaxID=126957 RepID=T1J8Z6_STRMM
MVPRRLRTIIFLAVLVLSSSLGSEEETCNLNAGSESTCDGISKYNNADWSDHLTDVEFALANYKSCEHRNCSCFEKTLDADLSPWHETGIGKEQIDQTKQFGTFYQIIDHKLYRQKDCLFAFRCSGVEYFLLRILDGLPDVEFVLNTRDWPQSPKQWKQMPIFSFSKTADYWDILYPAWSFWEGGPAISIYPTGLGRWDQHRKSISKAAEKWPWSNKTKKAFFRGSRTSPERDSLILLSRANPDLADAKYTRNQAWKSDADTLYEQPASEMSLEEHCQYKYLFNFRGVAASFRLKHLFLCKSLVFHVGDEWDEFFYPLLKPWVHYIPVKSGHKSSDLESLLQFAKRNDAKMQKIAQNGFDAIWTHVTMENVECYWQQLIRRFSHLQTYKKRRDSSLEEIKRKREIKK